MAPSTEKEKILEAVCLQHVNNLLCMDSSTDDSDEEDDVFAMFFASIAATMDNRRGVHLRVPKSIDWRVNVLEEMDDRRFSQMIHVNSAEFQHIFELIKNDPVFDSGASALQLSIKLQLQIVLYRLGCSGEGASIRKVASVFAIGDGGTIQIVTDRVLQAIINLKERFLFWQHNVEKQEILERAQYELPGCIGYLDGTEIRLAEAPSKDHTYYFSRKRQYAIKMQVICDDKLRIRQASYGHAGSIHDAKIFASCAVLRDPGRFCGRTEWIAADSAYALRPYVITPFRNNSNEFTKEQRDKYNQYFSKYRVKVENCFGKLKERFGSLKELKFRLHNRANKRRCNKWILSCCILQNILIDFNAPSDSSFPNNSGRVPLIPILQYENKREWLVNWINSRE